MFNLMIGIISVILHVLVVYYGWKMYKILNPVRYWTNAWLLYSSGNMLILIRRVIGLYIISCGELTLNMKIVWSVTVEYILQICVSILLLMFGMFLKKLYDKYFSNGVNIESWQQQNIKK